MLEPFATLAFLTVLWLAAKWMLDIVAANGGRIAAALSGHSTLAVRPQPIRPISPG